MVSWDLFTFSPISGCIPHRQTVGGVVGVAKNQVFAVFYGDSDHATLHVVGASRPALCVVGVA